jgi:hypothetical protein
MISPFGSKACHLKVVKQGVMAAAFAGKPPPKKTEILLENSEADNRDEHPYRTHKPEG